MDSNKINNGEENSYILLEESFYCSTPKIGVVSISNKKENEDNKYMNLVQDSKLQRNSFTFRLNKEQDTDCSSKDKETKSDLHSSQKYFINKRHKASSIKKFISQPIIYENKYEDENFISHCINSGNIPLYKSCTDIKEMDRKSEQILKLNYILKKNRKKIRKYTDNINNDRIADFAEGKKIKKKCTNKDVKKYLFSSQRLNDVFKLEKARKRDYHLKSSIALKRELSEKEKNGNINKNKISRIHSINEKVLKNVISFEKANINKNKVKKENYKFIKKYSSNLEPQKRKSMNLKIKFDIINDDSTNTKEKLVFNYKNKKEIIEILSNTENISNYYDYMEICLETLQEINIKEAPRSNYKLKLSFPEEKKDKKIALFDLDETLVHCVGEITENNKNNKEFINTSKIKVSLPNRKEILIGINIRPYWKESLDKIKNIYNIVIFTASHRAYSDAVLNYLDPDNKYFKYRLYRDSCVQYKKNDINFYVKDLDIFKANFNLKDIIIIDNSILSFAYHLNNGIPVVPFYDSQIDKELLLLSYYLISIVNYNDLRVANQENIKLEYFLKQIKYKEIESITTKKNLSVIELKEEQNEESKENIEKINIDDNKNGNKSEKKIFHIQFNRVHPEIKRLNTISNFSHLNNDFFEKWKNAFLKLSAKK